MAKTVINTPHGYGYDRRLDYGCGPDTHELAIKASRSIDGRAGYKQREVLLVAAINRKRVSLAYAAKSMLSNELKTLHGDTCEKLSRGGLIKFNEHDGSYVPSLTRYGMTFVSLVLKE